MKTFTLFLLSILILFYGSKEDVDLINQKSVYVNKAHFISENFIGEVVEKMIDLNGVETLCYVIKCNSQATEHYMGPWCPRNVEYGKEAGGIWFKDGKVYEVTGQFITGLDKFYDVDQWELYRENGSIKVTEIKKGCLATVQPEVEEAYHNFYVECMPSYFKDQMTTFYIPVNPIYQISPERFGRGGIGMALNGVKFDPPAPTHAILGAHTLASLDDHGGHVNPHGRYHAELQDSIRSSAAYIVVQGIWRLRSRFLTFTVFLII